MRFIKTVSIDDIPLSYEVSLDYMENFRPETVSTKIYCDHGESRDAIAQRLRAVRALNRKIAAGALTAEG